MNTFTNKQMWIDPKEAIVNNNELVIMVQQLQNRSCNGEIAGTNESNNDVNRKEIENETNMDIDERNNNSYNTRNGTPSKRGRNLVDSDIITTQSPKNPRTRGGFGTKEQNNHGSLVIHSRIYHH